MSISRVLSVVLRYGVLIVASILFLVPFYLIIKNGLSSNMEITSAQWQFFPSELHFENLEELFADETAPMLTGLWNSTFIAISQVIGQLFLASLAGYGMARIKVRYSGIIFVLIVGTMLIPGSVTFVPSYVLVSWLGWVSTLQGLLIPTLFSGFAAFLFRQFYLNFPKELEEAGRVDGLGDWGVFWRIVFPNSFSIFAALGVITFMNSWNAFLWPLVIGQDQSTWTVQVVLSTFLTAQTINLSQLFMGAAVAIFPLVVVFFVLQRYIVEGAAHTGIKG